MENYIKKHTNILSIICLLIVCILVYFFGIGNYALMDVDETRYVSMARDMFISKDFLTLYLNGEYFFEKPPLYFWIECLSFGLFGHINEFSARFPVALCATLTSFIVYFVGRKTVSNKFGLVSALILTTTIEFVMLARYAILDIVVTTMIGLSVMAGFLTQFVEDKNKKYFWWAFYIFSGFAVMAKGIPGFVIPFGVMFFVTLFNKTFKQCFKPSNIIPGIILFLLVVLPWHIIMLKIHNPLFFNEYIIKHHINRFFSSSEIGRKQPFYFYFITVLWGAMPYIFSVIGAMIEKICSGWKLNFENITQERKFLWFNIIAFGFTILFFSSSSTKLITYILPVYIFTSFIFGYFWTEYIWNDKYKKSFGIMSYILGGIFIFASIVAIFTKYFLPTQLYANIYPAKWLCIILLFFTGIFLVIFTAKKKPLNLFATLVSFIIILSAFGISKFHNIDYNFGQNDLMHFAKQEKISDNNLYVVNNFRKYSVLYYGGEKVYYISLQPEDEILKPSHEIFNSASRAIIRNKDVDKIGVRYNFNILEKGAKYSLVKFTSVKKL